MRLMRPSSAIADKGKVGAVAGPGRVPDPRDLVPDRLVYWGKTSIAFGAGMNLGDFQAVGKTHHCA